MQYPRECVDRLLEVIAESDPEDPPDSLHFQHNQRVRERFQPLPDRRDLERLLDVSYAASLQPEEGRYPSFAVAYITPDGVGSQAENFRFTSPRDFSPCEVAKLSPATDASSTFLAVWPRSDGLHIWGLVNVRDGGSAEAPRGGNPHFLDNSSCLIVRARAPGVLFVYHGQRLQLLYIRGDAYYRPPSARLLEALRDRARIPPLYANALSHIAARIALLGHGGTVLVTDPAIDVSPAVLEVSYGFEPPSLVLKKACDEYDSQQGNRRFSDAFSEALDWVAQLSQMDGAVQLVSDLAVKGFGAKIRLVESTSVQLYAAAAEVNEPRQVRLSEILGMRHRSAVLFCSQQVGQALAIVVSQDGDVTLFGRRNEEDGSVLMVGPFALGTGLAVG